MSAPAAIGGWVGAVLWLIGWVWFALSLGDRPTLGAVMLLPVALVVTIPIITFPGMVLGMWVGNLFAPHDERL